MTQDIVDVEFVSVRPGEGPAGTIPSPNSPASPAGAKGGEQFQILKAGEPGSRPSVLAGKLYVATVITAAAIAFVISGGHVLFTHRGETAPVNLTIRTDDPKSVYPASNHVVVSAQIHNPATTSRVVPDVLLTFEPSTGKDRLIYRVPRGETLAAGESLAFTVRMLKQPGYARAPSLRFN